jgi:RHS repeat-associated protein
MTGGANAIKLFDTGTASITVNGVQTTVSYGQSDTNLTVAGNLASAINANATAPVKASAAGGSVIVLTAKATGASTNYSVSASSATSQPTKFTQPSFTVAVSGATLTGGSASSTTMYSSTAYTPFGESYAQVGTADFSFTGLNQDTTPGLYDAEAREYGIQGRWPSPDPAGISSMHLEDPQTLNRYAYSRNNPLSLVDPSGKDPCDFDPSCGGDFGGGFGGFGDPIWGEQWPIYTGPPLDPSLIIFNLDDCVVNGPDAQTPVTCRQGDSITVTADPLPPPDTSDHWWRDFFKDLFSLDSFGQAQQNAWDRGYYSCIGNKLFPFKGLAAAAGAKATEEAVTHAAEKGGSKLAGAYYHFTDGRFTAWGKSSKVLVPELAESIAKVAKGVNIAGWVLTDVELAEAIHTCSERLGGGDIPQGQNSGPQ